MGIIIYSCQTFPSIKYMVLLCEYQKKNHKPWPINGINIIFRMSRRVEIVRK